MISAGMTVRPVGPEGERASLAALLRGLPARRRKRVARKTRRLASGGVVTRPTAAIVGERGPEAVVPLGRPTAAGRRTLGAYGARAGRTAASPYGYGLQPAPAAPAAPGAPAGQPAAPDAAAQQYGEYTPGGPIYGVRTGKGGALDLSGLTRQVAVEQAKYGMLNPLGNPHLTNLLRQRGFADARGMAQGAATQAALYGQGGDPTAAAEGAMGAYREGLGGLSKSLTDASLQSYLDNAARMDKYLSALLGYNFETRPAIDAQKSAAKAQAWGSVGGAGGQLAGKFIP